jgi:predicted metalloprotease with PDZ domain
LDGRAVDFDSFSKEIAAHKPSDTVRVTVLRLGEFKDFSVALKSSPYPTYTLKPMEHPTDQQKAIYNSWLGIKQ